MKADDIPKLMVHGEWLQACEITERSKRNSNSVRASLVEAVKRGLINKVTQKGSTSVYYCLPESIDNPRVLPAYPHVLMYGDMSGQPDPFRKRMNLCMKINRSV